MTKKYPDEFALIYVSLEHLELEALVETLEKINIHKFLGSEYNFNQEDYFQILAFIDCIEYIHRLRKWRSTDEGIKFAEEQLPFLEQLMGIKGLSNEVKYELMHHRGKFYVFVKDTDKAEEYFRQVIENVPKPFHSKLQLLKITYTTKTEEAKEHLIDIFKSFDENRQQVSISIVLAAFNELKKLSLKKLLTNIYLTELFLKKRYLCLLFGDSRNRIKLSLRLARQYLTMIRQDLLRLWR